ncbi:MAG: TMEM43 family protein, partial [Leptospirales bacterium]|nr:TMEM43 family protein [Leptospirales bacterium]
MAYTETTTTGYGDRLTNALKGVVGGFIMFIIGTVLLFWNEGNYVKTKKSIDEAQGVAVQVDDVSNVDPALNGKLIHASAFANTEDVLTDESFGISEKAIAISRKVEYYQNVEKSHTETKDKLGGGQEKITTYTYDQEWS